MKRVYLDTEYAYPGMRRNTPRPTARDTRQLVQIAAIIYDTNTDMEVASYNQLVFPAFDLALPDFFTELTGITQNDVEKKAIALANALDSLTEFIGELPIWTFDKDEEVLRQNCTYIQYQWPFTKPFVRVKELLPDWGIDPNSYSSGTLYKAANIELIGHVHDALHDVRSMAKAVSVFSQQ